MGHVFISHAADDRSEATLIYQRLLDTGIPAWLDSADLKANDNWPKQIEKALENATSGLLLLSPAALKSASCAHEYQTILAQNKHLVAALVEPVPEQDIPYYLQQTKVVDLTSNFEAGVKTLVEELQHVPPTAGPAPSRRLQHPNQAETTIELKLDLNKVDEDELAALIAKLADVGFRDIQVVNVDAS